MQLWEYLLLGFSFICLSLAAFAAVMQIFYPHEICINSHLKDKKIIESQSAKNSKLLKVEGPHRSLKNYALNEASFKAVFSRTMNKHQIETLYRVWKITNFNLEFRYDLEGNNIGEKTTKEGRIYIKLIYNLKAAKMYETILYLLEPNPPKPIVQTPIVPKIDITYNTPSLPIVKPFKPLSLQLLTGKSKGDKTLLYLNKEYPLNEYNLRLMLKEYVPAKGIDYCVHLWQQDPFHLHIVKDFNGSKDTFGQFSNFVGKKKCVISILESLAENTFFWTYLHEYAHLMAYRATGQVKHCSTFYRCFKKIGYQALEANILPSRINNHLYNFFEQPNRYSALDRHGRAA